MSAECEKCGTDLVGTQWDEGGLSCRLCDLERQLAEAKGKLDAVRAWRQILAEQLRDGGGAILDWNTLDRILEEPKVV